MTLRNLLPAIFCALCLAAAGAALADDAIDLTADKDGSATSLSWSGGSPEYGVFRSLSPADVSDPGNRLALTRESSYDDGGVPQSGEVFFYRVTQDGNCFTALADSYVRDQAPDANYGAETTLLLSPGPGVAHVQLRFSLDMIPDGARIALADLEIYEPGVTFATDAGAWLLGEDWSEPAVTWNDAPSKGAQDATGSGAADGWVRWDVTGGVQAIVDGDQPGFGFQLEAGPATPQMVFPSSEGSQPPRLCVRWTDDRGAGIQEMLGESDGSPLTEIEEQVTFFSGRTDASQFSGDPVLQALDFLVRNKSAFDLDDPQAQLYLKRIETGDDPGERQVFFGQRHAGNLRVEGADIAVHLHQDTVTSINSGLLTPVPPLSEVEITAWQAEQISLNFRFDPQGRNTLGTPELVVWQADALSSEFGRVELAWKVHARGLIAADETWEEVQFYIDAASGDVLETAHLTHGGGGGDRWREDFDIETVNGTPPSGSRGCWNGAFITADDDWYHEGGENGYDPADDPNNQGPPANNLTHEVYHYFIDDLLFASWDGGGGEIEVMLYADVPGAEYSRACDQMRFRNGFVNGDSMHHEFGHGVTFHGSGLRGDYLQGALAEHISDAFAAFNDEDGDQWLYGEDRPGGAIRSLEDPTAFGHPDQKSGLCTSWNNVCCTTWPCDDGGVHFNAGVGNKAVYLMTNGGLHNGVQVRGIGELKAGRLYRVLSTAWNREFSYYMSFYADARELAQNWASDGRNGFTDADVCSVINAWHAVGYGRIDADCDGQPDGQIDGDGDGRLNFSDNCPNVPNPGQENIDGDAFGDVCDTDADGDGIDNADDNCPLVSNDNQADDNGNGIGELCDDQDGDGIIVLLDNCPDDYNPDQRDSDADGIGNRCDTDRDGDGVEDSVDNCPYLYNLSQADSDGDNFGDACDTCPDTPNSQKDCNGDGIGDACQDDDDQDGVDDVDDNCRCVANPDQSELDGGPDGIRCDPRVLDQLDGLKDEAFIAFVSDQLLDHPIVIPFGPCVANCPDWLPPDTLTQVDVMLSGPRVVQVVDDRGFVVASANEVAPGHYRVEFEPAADSHYLSPGLSALPWSDLQATQSFALRSYEIEIWMDDPGVDPYVEVEVNVETTLGTP